MKHIVITLILAVVLLAPQTLTAQLSGGIYEIYADTFSFVSGNASIGGGYALYDSGGEFFAESTSGGDYTLRGGFRAVEQGILRVDTSETSVDYGVLTPGGVASSTISLAVWTDNAAGYTLFVQEDQDPTSNEDNTIDDVAVLGTVDGSTEAYGIAVSGDDAIPAGFDVTVTTSSQAVAQSFGRVEGRNTDLRYKVAIDAGTPDGIYRHTLIYRVLVNL